MCHEYQAPEPSPVQRLRRVMVQHQAAEEPTIQRYREAAGSMSDPLVAVVLEQITQDEIRHHEMMGIILRRLSQEMESGKAPATGGANDLTAAEVEEFIEHERTGVERLSALARDYRKLDGGLPSLLLDAIVKDSQKHKIMLQFVQRRLKA